MLDSKNLEISDTALDFKRIGQRIKEIRKMKEMSQAELAEAIGISTKYISLIETGNKRPSLTTLVKIGNVLGVTVDSFLYAQQENSAMAYCSELADLLEDCSGYEKRFICEMAFVAKKNLRENGCSCRSFRKS